MASLAGFSSRSKLDGIFGNAMGMAWRLVKFGRSGLQLPNIVPKGSSFPSFSWPANGLECHSSCIRRGKFLARTLLCVNGGVDVAESVDRATSQ